MNGDKEIELTVAEFNLVKCLAKIPGVVKDRNQLMDAMYGENTYVDDRTIDSHIKRLRKKFKKSDENFNRIMANLFDINTLEGLASSTAEVMFDGVNNNLSENGTVFRGGPTPVSQVK